MFSESPLGCIQGRVNGPERGLAKTRRAHHAPERARDRDRRKQRGTSTAFPKFVALFKGGENPGELLLQRLDEYRHRFSQAGGLPLAHVRGDLQSPLVLSNTAQPRVLDDVVLRSGLDG